MRSCKSWLEGLGYLVSTCQILASPLAINRLRFQAHVHRESKFNNSFRWTSLDFIHNSLPLHGVPAGVANEPPEQHEHGIAP